VTTIGWFPRSTTSGNILITFVIVVFSPLTSPTLQISCYFLLLHQLGLL